MDRSRGWPDRWRSVEELCHAALERDASARAAFLAQACGSDEDLRREVEALLAHEQTADRFLASPVGENCLATKYEACFFDRDQLAVKKHFARIDDV